MRKLVLFNREKSSRAEEFPKKNPRCYFWILKPRFFVTSRRPTLIKKRAITIALSSGSYYRVRAGLICARSGEKWKKKKNGYSNALRPIDQNHKARTMTKKGGQERGTKKKKKGGARAPPERDIWRRAHVHRNYGAMKSAEKGGKCDGDILRLNFPRRWFLLGTKLNYSTSLVCCSESCFFFSSGHGSKGATSEQAWK